jgi:threonine dehydrogenase-like Zn-dependent dehydrogenase
MSTAPTDPLAFDVIPSTVLTVSTPTLRHWFVGSRSAYVILSWHFSTPARYSIGPLRDPDSAGNIIGSDAAGEVVAVSSAVKHIFKGDRVFGFTYAGDTKTNGGFAEYVKLPQSVVAKMPKGMSYVEAAAFPVSQACSRRAPDALSRLS